MNGPTNTQFAIGVHVLTLLAATEVRSSEQMADSVRSNPVHIRRVLGRLRDAELVESKPGPGGGWRLRRSPGAIRLGDVWRAVQSSEHVLGLHEANPDCDEGRAIQAQLQIVSRGVTESVAEELDRTTIADVLASAALRRAVGA